MPDTTSTKSTHYRVYDVFTDHAFGGNPLAVITDATALPEAQLQKIAREFNYSETTFVYPPDDAAHTARVRIFTPTMEVPFAGHPTIGTAIALSDLGHTSPMVCELGVGPIPCTVSGNRASFITHAPLEIIATPDLEFVAGAISLPVTAITQSVHVPTQASLGLPFVCVEVVDRAALAACRPIASIFSEGTKRYPSSFDFAVFAYCRTGNHIDARMFAPNDDTPEDPATGSASAALTALLSKCAGTPLAFKISQGEDMGRPSQIKTEALEGDPMPIRVTGSAVLMMEGHIVV